MQLLTGIQPLTIDYLNQSKDKRSTEAEVWLDGWVVSMVTGALFDHDLWRHVMDEKSFMLSNIARKCNANEAYLHMGLRVLSALGWLGHRELHGGKDILFFHTPRTAYMFRYAPSLFDASQSRELWKSLPELVKREWTPQEKMASLRLQQCVQQEFAKAAHSSSDAIQRYTSLAAESAMLVPLLAALSRYGFIQNDKLDWLKLKTEASISFVQFMEACFVWKKWAYKEDGGLKLTKDGEWIITQAFKYASTIDQLDAMTQLPEVIFGKANETLNLASSGLAAPLPRKESANFIGEAKNIWKGLNPKPKAIYFPQCQDHGLILEILESLEISKDTNVKVVLSHHDPNALKVIQEVIDSQISQPLLAVEGDVNCPELISTALVNAYDISLSECFHINLSADTQREYLPSRYAGILPQTASQGVFLHKGQRLGAQAAQLSLIDFWEQWQPFMKKYGCLHLSYHSDLSCEQRDYIPGMLAVAVQSYLNSEMALEKKCFEYVLEKAGVQVCSYTALSSGRHFRYLKA